MGTRAVYSFLDEHNVAFHVYKHWDNNPEGAAGFLTNALEHAWDLPRYEHDEFAAAFIAANKKWGSGGDIRMCFRPENHCDIEYLYEISQAKNGQMIMKAFEVNFWDESKPLRKQIFYGRLKDFVIEYGDDRAKMKWDNNVKSDHKAYDPDNAERKLYEKLKAKFEGVA